MSANGRPEDFDRCLGRLHDLPDGAARGVAAPPGGFIGLLLIRCGDAARVYVNACPHIGVSLNLQPDRFLSADGSVIVCATHGAEFAIADGLCLRGPCAGDRLEIVPSEIRDGMVWVSATAGL